MIFKFVFCICLITLLVVDVVHGANRLNCDSLTPFYQKPHELLKLKEVAEHGDAEMQYELAKLYLKGYYIKQDFKEAFRWFKKAAMQGYYNAISFVSNSYYYGKNGVIQDYQEAVKWYRIGAYFGHNPSLSKLAYAYLNGRGVNKNIKEAAILFRIVAESTPENRNFVELGRIYSLNEGVPVDLIEAYKWFYIAGKDNNKEAAIELIKLKNKMTPEEISVAEIAGDKKAKEIEDKSIIRLPCAYD